jgi:hypothetical protein
MRKKEFFVSFLLCLCLLLVVFILSGCIIDTKYRVYYHQGNSTGNPPVDSKEYYAGNRITVLGQGSLINHNYTFLGWRNSSTFLIHYPGEFVTMQYGDINFHPVWDDGTDIPFSFNIKNEEAIITRYNEQFASFLVIPNTIQSKPVTIISDNVFSNLLILELKLPIHLKHIGIVSFESNNISDLIIPDSVESIGTGAFRNNRLTRLNLGNGIKTIGPYAFSNNRLKAITIPESITTIDIGVFHENEIVTIVIGEGVEIKSDISFGIYGASFRELYN